MTILLATKNKRNAHKETRNRTLFIKFEKIGL